MTSDGPEADAGPLSGDIPPFGIPLFLDIPEALRLVASQDTDLASFMDDLHGGIPGDEDHAPARRVRPANAWTIRSGEHPEGDVLASNQPFVLPREPHVRLAVERIVRCLEGCRAALSRDFTDVIRDDLDTRPECDDDGEWVGELTEACTDLIIASLAGRPLPVARLRSMVDRLVAERSSPPREKLVPAVAFPALSAIWEQTLVMVRESSAYGDSLVIAVSRSFVTCVDGLCRAMRGFPGTGTGAGGELVSAASGAASC